MGTTLTLAKSVFRDFTIDGAPASGAYDPPKKDVVSVFKTADDRLVAIETATLLASIIAGLSGPPPASAADTDTLLLHKTDDGTFRLITVGWLRNNLVEQWYPFDASALVTGSAAVLIPADPDRNSVSFANCSTTETVLLKYGGALLGRGVGVIPVLPGGSYSTVHDAKDALWAITENGNTAPIFARYTNTSNVDVVSNAVAAAFFAKLSGAQTTADKAALTTLIAALRNSGALQQMRSAYILAQTDIASAIVDLVRLTSATVHGTLTPNLRSGISGDGSTGYLDTGYVPKADTQFGLSAHSFGVYVRGSAIAGAGALSCGFGTGAIGGNRSATAAAFRSATASSDVVTTGGRGGLFSVTRTDPSKYRAYWQGNGFDVATAASSLGASALPFFLFGNNGSSGVNSLSTSELSFFFAGAPLTDAQHAAVQTAFAAYLTALGVTP